MPENLITICFSSIKKQQCTEVLLEELQRLCSLQVDMKEASRIVRVSKNRPDEARAMSIHCWNILLDHDFILFSPSQNSFKIMTKNVRNFLIAVFENIVELTNRFCIS